jgi:hypothetical protein
MENPETWETLDTDTERRQKKTNQQSEKIEQHA